MTEAPPQEDWSYLWFPQSGFVHGGEAFSSLMSVWYVFACELEFYWGCLPTEDDPKVL